MIFHIKACELDGKQRETNHKNSLLPAGFTTAPSASNNAALMSQAGFQMFKSSMSTKVTPEPAPANVFYNATPASSVSTSSNATAASNIKNDFIAFFSE
ncbi:hypothetical protein Hanom_Chr06g00496881 [Helianthus anomalus]